MYPYGELLVYICFKFFFYRKIDPVSFCCETVISRRRFKDYISILRLALSEFEYYNVSIEYDRKEKVQCY